MKTIVSLFAVALLIATTAQAAEFKSDADKRSYAIGAAMAKNLKQQEIQVDGSLVAEGLNEGLADKSRLTDAEISAIMQQIQQELRQQQMAKRDAAAAANRQRGEAFLAENKEKEGVAVLPGGVQYKVLKAGTGAKPTATDTIVCNYRGTLVDGTEFDASTPGKPVTFKVGQVIPGWQEALKEMPVGSKWQIVVPAAKAYGPRGAAPKIGPEETLVFEVELLEIRK